VGESVPLVSYHLRQLAANGFVDEAGELARDGRERWWRARHQITSWDVGEFLDSPERLAAGQALSAEVARRYAEVLASWVAELPSLPRGWIGKWELMDRRLELAPDELVELRDSLAEVIERFVDRPRRDDTEPVIAVVELLPIPRPGP
jgi:DNA-binding transcriptional ArsR family regulator